jgi:orotate phosphoribosyltransferase
MAMSEDVIRILKESKAMLTGHFLLSSGKHSSQYFQCARILQYPDRAATVIGYVVERLKADRAAGKLEFDCIIGPAMGGIIPAYEAGRQLGVPSFFTERNDSGQMTLRRGFEIRGGERVIIAEDVVTTGKSTLETAEQIEEMGGIIVASFCIVDRRSEESAETFPWPFYSAVRIPAETWNARDCLLCREGKQPVVKPGSRKVF